MPDQLEKAYSRLRHRENLRMWGQLYLGGTGQTVGGWLVDSWSENGAPYWGCKMHWFDRKGRQALPRLSEHRVSDRFNESRRRGYRD